MTRGSARDAGGDGAEVEPLPLAALNGAVLTWTGADGEEHSVQFEDHSSSGE